MSVPTEVITALEASIGAVRSVQPLGGLSGRTVALVRGSGGMLVIKGPVPAAEASFAVVVAPRLAATGVRVPPTSVVDTASGEQWLLVDHIPDALPTSRWGADPEAICLLRSLHSLPLAIVDTIEDRYRPCWTAELTTAAVSNLDAADGVAEQLARLSLQSQYLFTPMAVVSADPNPSNWRVDRDGSVVLIDWERITTAHPAIDLGILMPGLGDSDAARRISEGYADDRVHVADILRAKAWSIVELAATSSPSSEAGRLVRRHREPILHWLAATEF